MRSGISHLSKRADADVRQEFFGTAAAMEPEIEPVTDVASEVDEPRWSVVSFDRQEAGGLTYSQASALMAELDAHGMNGLCVITDEAARRYGS